MRHSSETMVLLCYNIFCPGLPKINSENSTEFGTSPPSIT